MNSRLVFKIVFFNDFVYMFDKRRTMAIADWRVARLKIAPQLANGIGVEEIARAQAFWPGCLEYRE